MTTPRQCLSRWDYFPAGLTRTIEDTERDEARRGTKLHDADPSRIIRRDAQRRDEPLTDVT